VEVLLSPWSAAIIFVFDALFIMEENHCTTTSCSTMSASESSSAANKPCSGIENNGLLTGAGAGAAGAADFWADFFFFVVVPWEDFFFFGVFGLFSAAADILSVGPVFNSSLKDVNS
jgi:hypothetical protein